MKTKEILEEITSRDTHKVWRSSCHIISISQNNDEIKPLLKHIDEIKSKTKDLDMGGAFAPNQRFIDSAIKVLEFHENLKQCPCFLLLGLGRDPNKEVEQHSVKIINITYMEDSWVDFYNVACEKCSTKYKVIEREAHFKWWKWEKV